MKYCIFLIFSLLLFSCGKKTMETKPVRKDVTETVFASGVLEAKGTYNLTAQVDGYLIKINFDEGDIVSAGKVLAIVDNKENNYNTESSRQLYNIARENVSSKSPALMQAKNAMDVARQKMEQDGLQEQRYKRLLDNNSIAKVDYENILLSYTTSKKNYETAVENYKKALQETRQQLITNRAASEINSFIFSKNQIKAVISGKIYKKFKEEGDFVRKGDVIATIGHQDHIYAKVNIDESNIKKVKVGLGAFIQLNIDKSKIYKGSVEEIYPAFDEGSQSFLCKLIFEDSLDFKIINTQLEANIIVGKQKNALLIPRNFLDAGGFVMIKGKNEKTLIKTNFVSSDWVQVLSGIDDNTVLVTDNIAEIDSTTLK